MFNPLKRCLAQTWERMDQLSLIKLKKEEMSREKNEAEKVLAFSSTEKSSFFICFSIQLNKRRVSNVFNWRDWLIHVWYFSHEGNSSLSPWWLNSRLSLKPGRLSERTLHVNPWCRMKTKSFSNRRILLKKATVSRYIQSSSFLRGTKTYSV